jgi:RNA recognition motif-containing protein
VVFVGNVPYEIQASDVEDAFRDCGVRTQMRDLTSAAAHHLRPRTGARRARDPPPGHPEAQGRVHHAC